MIFAFQFKAPKGGHEGEPYRFTIRHGQHSRFPAAGSLSQAERSNCSAITSGAWLGNMMPPDPTRMLEVPLAMCPITTAVAALAMPCML